MSKLKIITIFAITTILANAAAINDIEKGEGMGIPIGKGSYAEVNSVAIGKQSKANVANSITIGDDSKTEYKNNDSGIAYDKLKKIYVKKEEIKVFNDKEFMEKLKIDHAQHLKNGVMEYDKINSLAHDIQEYAQNKLASKEEKDESKKKEYEKKANEHLENLKNHHFTFLLTNEEKGKVTEEKLKKILDNMIKPNRKNPGENIMYKVLKRADKVIEKYKEYKIHEKALSNLTDDKIKEDLLKDYYLKDDKYYLKIRNVVVGDNASGIGRNLTAIGGNAVSHDFGTSVGYNSKSIGANSVAVGSNATALTLDSVVIGSNAISKDENMENGVTIEELEIMYKNKILHERLKDYEEKAKKHDPFDAFIRDTYEGDARNDYKWYKETDAPISKQYTEEEFVKQYVYFKRLERLANQIYYDPLVKKQIKKILESEYEVREIETENGKVKKYYRKKLNDDSKSKLNTVIGYDSQSVGSKNVAIGATTKVYDSSIGIGYMAQSFDKGIAIGLKSITNAENSISIGNNTQNYGSDSVLIGSSSHNIAKDGIVIGKDSGAVSDNSVVIGKNSFSYHRKQWVNANTIVTKEEAKKQIKKEIESVINSIIRMEKSSYDIETEYTLFAKELYARYPNDISMRDKMIEKRIEEDLNKKYGRHASFIDYLEKKYSNKTFDEIIAKSHDKKEYEEFLKDESNVKYYRKDKLIYRQDVYSINKGYSNIVIGDNSEAYSDSSIVIGSLSSAKGYDNIAIGTRVKVDNSAIAIGRGAMAGIQGEGLTGNSQIAIGNHSKAFGEHGISMGVDAFSSNYGVSIGTNAKTDKDSWSAVSLGTDSVAKAWDSVALGSYSMAQTKKNEDKYFNFITNKIETISNKSEFAKNKGIKYVNDENVSESDPQLKKVVDKDQTIIGRTFSVNKSLQAWFSTHGAISVGDVSKGYTRQINGLAAGTKDTDAVNVAQLRMALNVPINFFNGGRVKNNIYTPESSWTSPLYSTRIAFGDGIKAEEVSDEKGNKYTRVTLDKDSINNDNTLKGPKGEPGKKGDPGTPGKDGVNGKSHYELWLEKNGKTDSDTTKEEYEKTMKGKDGLSAYEVWKQQGNNGTEQDFLNSLKGKDGKDGKGGADFFEYAVRIKDKDTPLIEAEDGKLYTKEFLDKNEYKNNKWFEKGTNKEVTDFKDKCYKKTDEKLVIHSKEKRIIANVKAGVKDTDVVNVSQLNKVKTEVTNILNKVEKADEKANLALGGVSNAIAMANLVQVNSYSRHRHNLSAAYGYYGGAHALAIGFSGVNEKRNFVYKLSGSVNNHGNLALGLGIGVMLGEKENEYPNKTAEVEKLMEKVSNLEKSNEELRKENREIKEMINKLLKK